MSSFKALLKAVEEAREELNPLPNSNLDKELIASFKGAYGANVVEKDGHSYVVYYRNGKEMQYRIDNVGNLCFLHFEFNNGNLLYRKPIYI